MNISCSEHSKAMPAIVFIYSLSTTKNSQDRLHKKTNEKTKPIWDTKPTNKTKSCWGLLGKTLHPHSLRETELGGIGISFSASVLRLALVEAGACRLVCYLRREAASSG